jgi:3-deoxy-7-phosphoheptulonate synthase
MIIVMRPGAEEKKVERVIERLISAGCDVHRSTGAERTLVGAIGVTAEMDLSDYEILPGVEKVLRVSTPYKLVARSYRPEGTTIELGADVRLGGEDVVVMAGPGQVESEEQIERTAAEVARAGAKVLRASAFTPRSRPYAFPGLGEQGLQWLRAAAREHGLLACSEVIAPDQVGIVAGYVDVLLVGGRHMQNHALLRELGGVDLPVILKRSISATVDDWLLAAEYVAVAGNDRIALCERGIRSFDSADPTTLDLAAIPTLRRKSHLPILCDPSYGTGHRDKVAPMARAAVAAGADGLLIEVHHDADEARSDAAQTLYPESFQRLMDQLRIIVPALGRSI